MVLDSPSVVAMLFNEPESDDLLRRVEGDPKRLISAGTVLELETVLTGRYGSAAAADLDKFLIDAQIRIVPFDGQQLRHARHATRRFGKGRSPARLNLGDCFAYALAKHTGEPLLFKGDDLTHTDVLGA